MSKTHHAAATRTAPEPAAPAPEDLRSLAERALAEDVGAGDLTTELTIPKDFKAHGVFIAQQPMIMAGLPVAAEVFRTLEPGCYWEAAVAEGAAVRSDAPLATVRGGGRALLAGERVALNFLQRLSGIATLTHQLKMQLRGLKVELLDTRKTTPGLRALEKYAVRVGGGQNHRARLDDGILIKNNHLRLTGGIAAAVANARRNRSADKAHLAIEVEVTTLAELEEAIAAGAEAVLLDNMTPAQVRNCVEKAAGRVRLEVSGGLNASNLRTYARTGVDCLSVGALTHSAPAVQIHFKIEPL